MGKIELEFSRTVIRVSMSETVYCASLFKNLIVVLFKLLQSRVSSIELASQVAVSRVHQSGLLLLLLSRFAPLRECSWSVEYLRKV